MTDAGIFCPEVFLANWQQLASTRGREMLPNWTNRPPTSTRKKHRKHRKSDPVFHHTLAVHADSPRKPKAKQIANIVRLLLLVPKASGGTGTKTRFEAFRDRHSELVRPEGIGRTRGHGVTPPHEHVSVAVVVFSSANIVAPYLRREEGKKTARLCTAGMK